MGVWSPDDIDGLEGKMVVVTGGTSGIGFETARALASKGARVWIAADDVEKGEEAAKEIQRRHPHALVHFHAVNLGSQASLSTFVDDLFTRHASLDILINNAGLAGVPDRHETLDGHELIFGVNFLGHFSLTAKLFPLLMRSSDPRVICVSSLEHQGASISFDDPDLRSGYSARKAYAQSKLALLMFAKELHRRCEESGIPLRSIPVHPGAVKTHIFDRGPEIVGEYFHPLPLWQRLLLKTFGQEVSRGALPLLFAATSVEARSGVYYGPDGWHELWGSPTEAKVAVQAENLWGADKLWRLAEEMTGVAFDVVALRSIGLH